MGSLVYSKFIILRGILSSQFLDERGYLVFGFLLVLEGSRDREVASTFGRRNLGYGATTSFLFVCY